MYVYAKNNITTFQSSFLSLSSCFFKYNNNKSDDDDDEETIDLKKNFFFFFKDQRLFFKSRSASVLILMLDGHQHLMQCVCAKQNIQQSMMILYNQNVNKENSQT